MKEKTEELIAEFGNQAYHVAVEFTVIATHIGDTVGAEMFSESARELLEAGYHKHPKQDDISGGVAQL
jgi:hypothetical protein